MHKARGYEVWFRPDDLDKSTVLIGRYEAQSIADKICLVLKTCATEGESFVLFNAATPEPS